MGGEELQGFLNKRHSSGGFAYIIHVFKKLREDGTRQGATATLVIM